MPVSRISLYCVPYAGSSATVYVRWQQRLPAWIQLIPVELPGRGRRIQEPLESSLPALISRITADVDPSPSQPFALFGHSLGALIAYELALQLEARGRAPALVFASGTCSPGSRDRERFAALKTDAELRAELRRLDGTPQSVLESEELMELALPILRADFQLAESYVESGRTLRAPLVAFGGQDDPTTSNEAIAGWRDQTSGDFAMHLLPGGHFFIHEQPALLFALLERHLRAALPAAAEARTSP